MSPLRKQMEADMVLRGLAYRTRDAYLEAVIKLAKFYGRTPAEISEEEVQRYLLYLLQERKLAHSSCNIVCSALQFFYRVTLKRREAEFCLPRPKVPSRLPEILSPTAHRIAPLLDGQPTRALVVPRRARGCGAAGGADRAGITKDCGIHGLRHAFATYLLEAGVNVHRIQRLMGHGSLNTTARYFHLAQPHRADTASPLDLLERPDTTRF